MKLFLLLTFLLISTAPFAQETVAELPTGVYSTYLLGKNAKLDKWQHGDVVLLNDEQYKLSNEEEIGKYKFSETAQRVFFLTGPLQGVFAKTTLNNKKPTIILPSKENQRFKGKFIETDIVAYFKKD